MYPPEQVRKYAEVLCKVSELCSRFPGKGFSKTWGLCFLGNIVIVDKSADYIKNSFLEKTSIQISAKGKAVEPEVSLPTGSKLYSWDLIGIQTFKNGNHERKKIICEFSSLEDVLSDLLEFLFEKPKAE